MGTELANASYDRDGLGLPRLQGEPESRPLVQADPHVVLDDGVEAAGGLDAHRVGARLQERQDEITLRVGLGGPGAELRGGDDHRPGDRPAGGVLDRPRDRARRQLLCGRRRRQQQPDAEQECQTGDASPHGVDPPWQDDIAAFAPSRQRPTGRPGKLRPVGTRTPVGSDAARRMRARSQYMRFAHGRKLPRTDAISLDHKTVPESRKMRSVDVSRGTGTAPRNVSPARPPGVARPRCRGQALSRPSRRPPPGRPRSRNPPPSSGPPPPAPATGARCRGSRSGTGARWGARPGAAPGRRRPRPP